MKNLVFFLLLLVVLGGTACCVFLRNETRGDKGEIKDADPRAAELMLRNLADAMKMYSAQHGGGGFSKFSNSLAKLDGLHANKIKPALSGPDQTSFGGYVVRLAENPQGDNFATDFRIIAYPANGYRGETFAIDKKEKIYKYDEGGF